MGYDVSVIAHLFLTVQLIGPGSQLHEEMCDEFPVGKHPDSSRCSPIVDRTLHKTINTH